LTIPRTQAENRTSMEAHEEVGNGLRDRYVEAESGLFRRLGLDARTRFVHLREPSLRVRVIEAGEGVPLLLVHGGGGSASVWAPLMAKLPGFRIVAVDRPGSGLSEEFDYTGKDVRAHAVSFLASLLDELGLSSAPIVANSMGGLWTFWLALQHPERVTAIAQLGCPALMLGTSAPLSMRLLAVRTTGSPIAALDPDPRKVLAGVAGARAVDRLPQEAIDCLALAERMWAHGATRLSLLRGTLQLDGARAEASLFEAEVARITQPVLFLWGDADTYGPPDRGRAACELMPNAAMEVLKAGHLPWLDDPDRCAKGLLDFLRAHVAT
jgi:2-hydroxy-6-oxonona-2,4-dienedioate hydrolase